MHVVAENYEQTHTWDNHSNDNNKDYNIRSAEAHTYNNYINVCKTAQHEVHALIWSNNETKCFTRKQTCNGVYTKHCTRSWNQLKMAVFAKVSKKRSNFRIRQFKEKHH